MPDPITYTLPLSGFIQMFATPTALPGPTSTPIPYTFDFIRLITSSSPYVTQPGLLTIGIAGDSIVTYYVGLRMAMTAILFVVGFVASRLGIPIATEPVVRIGERKIGERMSLGRLPKIPKL